MAKKRSEKLSKVPNDLKVTTNDLLKMQRVPAMAAAAVCIAVYSVFHDITSAFEIFFNWQQLVLFLGAYFVSLLLHEAVHTAGFMLFGGLPLKSVKITSHGALMVTHPRGAVNIWPFRLGTALPGILMGVVPLVWGVISGIGWLALYGALMVGSAMPDLLVLWATRFASSNSAILYQPEPGGYEIQG